MNLKCLIQYLQSGMLVLAMFLCASCAGHRSGLVPELPKKVVDDFALLDHRGKFQQLYYYSDQKAVVIFSHGIGCPIVRKSVPYLEGLQKKYAPQGVTFLMINANTQDTREDLIKEATDYGITMPILEDPSQVVTAMLGIRRTADAVVIDPKDWSVVYQGPIHDQFGYETQRPSIDHPYLDNVLKAMVQGKPVPQERPKTLGCLITFEQRGVPDYVHNVAPILISKCITCHSPGQIGPWSMDNYAKVKGWASMVREVVLKRRMPPWGADPHYRKLRDDISLTPQEIRAINDWAVAGAPRGDGADPLLTAARPTNQTWPLGKPDLILSGKNPRHIPAHGKSYYVKWKPMQFIDQDVWVRAYSWRLGNPKAIHHTLLIANKENWIAGYTQSSTVMELPDGVGDFLPKGTTFTVSMHYMPTGKPETDDTEIGLYFLKKPPKKKVMLKRFDITDLKIPPHEKNYISRVIVDFPEAVNIFSIRTHMHFRGRSDICIAHYPDGKSETILSIPQYRFFHQPFYFFKEPIHLPAGSKIETIAVYDNSAQNPDNPDPNKEVHKGGSAYDEMRMDFFSYYTDK